MATLDIFLMDKEQKKAFLLLKLIIFNYHGLDADEKSILERTADKLDARDALKWAYEFNNMDPVNAFERARLYFKETVALYEKDTRFEFIKSVWDDTQSKGYVSEIEAMGMLKFAKDWGVQKELLSLVRK